MPKPVRTKQTPPKPQRVLLIGERMGFLRILAEAILNDSSLSVCGQARATEAALEALARLHPEVVVLDLGSAAARALVLIRKLATAHPHLKLLAVASKEDAGLANRVLREGGSGCILEREGFEEILHAIHDLTRGGIYVSEAILAASPRKRPAKSPAGGRRRKSDSHRSGEG